jgi:hypothetical protein
VISEPFANILRADRDEYNRRFAEARLRYPALTGEAFGEFLLRSVDGIVAAVCSVCPERATEVVSCLYDAALELVGRNLAGPSSRNPTIDEGWRTVLPAAAGHLAEAPGRVTAAVSNGLHHLTVTPGARPARWIRDLASLAADCGDADTFLRAGQVAAWTAGLSQYRTGALEILDTLPNLITAAILKAPSGTDVNELRNRLRDNPWYDPSHPEDTGTSSGNRIRVVRRAGAFRGFGGQFTQPPRVTARGDNLLVASGGECWLLTADAYGATFHRHGQAGLDAAEQGAGLPPSLIVTGSKVKFDGAVLDLAEWGSVTSAAVADRTLAVTSSLSHAVTLIALP